MVKTGVDQFTPEDRKLIRSHVMKGKNLGKIRPPRSRADLNVVDWRQDASSSSSNGADTASLDGGREGSSSTTPISECSSVVRSPATVPRKFGSVASAICFADSVMPATVEVVLRCEQLIPFVHLIVVETTKLIPDNQSLPSPSSFCSPWRHAYSLKRGPNTGLHL